jgi:hypothetical protein
VFLDGSGEVVVDEGQQAIAVDVLNVERGVERQSLTRTCL